SHIYLNKKFKPNQQITSYEKGIYDHLIEIKHDTLKVKKGVITQTRFIFQQLFALSETLYRFEQHIDDLKESHNQQFNIINSRLTQSEQTNKNLLNESFNNTKQLQKVDQSLYSLNNLIRPYHNVQRDLSSQFQSHHNSLKGLQQSIENLSNRVLFETKHLEQLQMETKQQVTNESSNMSKTITGELMGIKESIDQLTQKQKTMCDLFKHLSAGTKVKHLIVSGVKVNVSSFIQLDSNSLQLKFIKEDGNLFITQCQNVEGIEIETKRE
ncbi:hypothetical protein, partial [Alkalibacillus haloalkaliphilus]|uniref:hypothetical protein n=1 Tax=Alkalibacillus haloalkaliphilus TaxID=94136 RepID=UPI000496A4A4